MSEKKKQVRENFKNAVFKRDRYKCKFCDETENLDAHHIFNRNDMPNGGYVKENGITLCPVHHRQAEQFHETGEAYPGMSPEQLMKKIFSSYDLAVRMSNKLK